MNKSTSKHPRFSAYIPATLLERLKQQAHIDRRSMNAQLVWYLEYGLQHSEPQKRQQVEAIVVSTQRGPKPQAAKEGQH